MKINAKNHKQRFLSLMLAVVMVVGLLPNFGVKANGYTMDDTDVSNLGVGSIIEAGDTVANTNNPTGSPAGGNNVKIVYQDVNGTELITQIIAAGDSHTVLKYSEAEALNKKTGGILLAEHRSDKWLITSADKYDVGTAVTGGDISRVYVSAVPRYTIDWDPSTTDTYSPLVTTDAFKVTIDRTNTASPIDTSAAAYKLTRTGYTFNGWKLADGTLNPTIKQDNVTSYDTLDGTTAAGPGPVDYVIKLYADWTQNITIECIYNCPLVSKKTFVYDTQTIVSGTAPVQPSDPVEPGFTFGGWYADEDCTKVFDFTIARTTDAKAYAKWTRNENYTLTFNNNIPAGEDASIAIPNIIAVPFYTASGTYYNVSLPGAPVNTNGNVYEHYNFTGWSVDVTPAPAAGANKYTGNADMDKLMADLGADNSTIPMIANWTAKDYTVKMDYDAPAAVSPVPANPADQTKPYGTGAGSTVSVVATMGVSTVSHMFAGWSLTKGATTADYTADTDIKTLVDAAEKAGITFESTSAVANLKDTLTLYGVWTENAKGTITFDGNGSDGGNVASQTDYVGANITIPANGYTRTGYTFKEWNTSKNGDGKGSNPGDAFAIAGDRTLYAIWTAIPTYTVTWNNYDGTALKTENLLTGTIPAYTGTPTRAADAANTYTFSGWNDGTTTYAVGAALPAVTANVTYTAQYTAVTNNYTITWKDGNGNTLGTSTVAYGTVPAYTLAATPTKKADATNTYTFSNSWTPALTAVTGDATYTAQFTATPIATSPAPASPSPASPAPVSPAPVSPAPVSPAPVSPAPTAPVAPNPTETVTPTPAEVKAKFYDIEYYEEIDGEEVRLKKTANPDTYEYGVGAEIKYGLDKEGYTFEGWYSKKSNKYVEKIGKKTKGTVKLYAIFTPVDDGSKDEGNNGSGQPASEFGVLCVRLIDYTEDSMTLTWNLLENVDGYDIFGSRCNSKDVIRAYEPIDTVEADVNEYLADNLLTQTYYKFYVRAFILVNGEKRYITTSINVHGVTLNDTYGVADEINIDKVVLKYTNGKSKTKYNREKDGDAEEINITMKVGQSLTIITSEYNKDGKEIRAHRPISFESSDTNICKVGKKNSHKYGVEVKGKANTYKSRAITAKAEGECTIYVFAQNGLYTKINVTVKK